MPEILPLQEGYLWAVLPVYNNRGTLRQVVSECCELLENVVVVDDGSTDVDVSVMLGDLDVTVLVHESNRGKGEAILTASRYIEEQGGVYMVTVDTDGQHIPADIEKFIPVTAEDDC